MDLENSVEANGEDGTFMKYWQRLGKLQEAARKVDNAWNELVNLAEKIPRESGQSAYGLLCFPLRVQ